MTKPFLIIIAALIYITLCWWIFRPTIIPVPTIAPDYIKRSMRKHGIQVAFVDGKGA
jgi:predicted ABC-type sugar transport system permease subunit